MQDPEVQAGIPANRRRPVGRVTERILRKVWHLRVARTGFHDLENHDNPDAPLSNAGAPSHMYDHSGVVYSPGSARMEEADRGTLRLVRAYRDAELLAIESTAEYYRQIEHLAWRFDDTTERAIAVALSDGHGVRRIKADLHVGQRRIERVLRTVREWMNEPRETDDG